MTKTRTETLHRSAVLAFMAIVTTCLLALALSQSRGDGAALVGMVAYSFAAGFGLEFVGSAWAGARRRRDSDRA